MNNIFLSHPEDFSVSQISLMSNIGTLAVILTDKSGQQFPCCFQNAFSVYPGRLYIGASHPSESEAHMPELGSDAQHLVVNVLGKYLNSRYTQEKQDWLSTRNYHNAFDPHTCWKSSWTITEQEYADWLLLKCINTLQMQTDWARTS